MTLDGNFMCMHNLLVKRKRKTSTHCIKGLRKTALPWPIEIKAE